jgi:hypothetical protein
MRSYMPPKPPEREYGPCPLSGEPIEHIFSAVQDPESGRPAILERAIERVSRNEELGENERLCYIGDGNFGVVYEERRGKNTVVEIRRRIEYENRNDKADWRKELSPGISRDYVPEPRPLSELYTQEEILSFPKFTRAGSYYVPRTG